MLLTLIGLRDPQRFYHQPDGENHLVRHLGDALQVDLASPLVAFQTLGPSPLRERVVASLVGVGLLALALLLVWVVPHSRSAARTSSRATHRPPSPVRADDRHRAERRVQPGRPIGDGESATRAPGAQRRAAITRHATTGRAAGARAGADGYQRRWVTEDAFISLRVVQQVLAGNGPVFNAGERVEAYTLRSGSRS